MSVCFRPIARQRSPAGGAPAAFFMWSHRRHLRSRRRSQTLLRHLPNGLGNRQHLPVGLGTPTIAGRWSGRCRRCRRVKRSRCLRRSQRRCARPRHPCSPRHPCGFRMVRTCRCARQLGLWNASRSGLPHRLSASLRRRRRASPPTAAKCAPCPPRMLPPSPPAPSAPRMRITHSPRHAAQPSL